MATGDADVMIGSPGEVTIADALARGALTVADVTAAWPVMRAAALDVQNEPPAGRQGRSDVVVYDALGYVPTTRRASVSSTLEYQIDDVALATVATAVGDVDAATRLRARATGWRRLYDPDTGFLRGRDEAGAFVPDDAPFDPTAFGSDYVEASAWQSLFPLDDVEGIEAVYGGRAGAVKKLDELLTLTEADWATRDPASSLFGVSPLPYHWQGNEPSLHVSALPFELGNRALGQRFVAWVKATQYHADVAGVPGNDDGGATSATNAPPTTKKPSSRWSRTIWSRRRRTPTSSCCPTTKAPSSSSSPKRRSRSRRATAAVPSEKYTRWFGPMSTARSSSGRSSREPRRAR